MTLPSPCSPSSRPRPPSPPSASCCRGTSSAMAVWLLFTLVGVSLLYFLLGAEFVGAAQLIVYVGGTLVLVVFGVMLTAQGPFASCATSRANGSSAASLGGVLFGLLIAVSCRCSSATAAERQRPTPRRRAARAGFLGVTETSPNAQPHRRARRDVHCSERRSRTCCRSRSCRCTCWWCCRGRVPGAGEAEGEAVTELGLHAVPAALARSCSPAASSASRPSGTPSAS